MHSGNLTFTFYSWFRWKSVSLCIVCLQHRIWTQSEHFSMKRRRSCHWRLQRWRSWHINWRSWRGAGELVPGISSNSHPPLRFLSLTNWGVNLWYGSLFSFLASFRFFSKISVIKMGLHSPGCSFDHYENMTYHKTPTYASSHYYSLSYSVICMWKTSHKG